MKSLENYHLGTSAIRDHLLGSDFKPLCRSAAYIVAHGPLTPSSRHGVTCVKCQQVMVRHGIHPKQDKQLQP